MAPESYQVEGYNLVLSDYFMDQDVKAICIACDDGKNREFLRELLELMYKESAV